MWGKTIATAVVVIALVGTGCSNTEANNSASSTTTSQSPDDALAVWGRDKFAPALDDIGEALIWIGGAAKNMDFTDMRAGARALDDAAEAFEQQLPSPNLAINEIAKSAINNLQKLAEGTQGLSRRSDREDFDQLSRYRKTAEDQLQAIMDRVKSAQNAAS